MAIFISSRPVLILSIKSTFRSMILVTIVVPTTTFSSKAATGPKPMDTPHLAGEDTLSIKIFDSALCRLKRTRRNIPQELIKDFALHGLGPMSYHHGLTRTPASSWTSILTPHTSAQAVGGHSRDTLTQCALSLYPSPASNLSLLK